VCAGCVALAGLASCATDQRGDVERYRAISDPAGAEAVAVEPAADAQLTLVQALRLTATRNEQLAAQGERYIQALAERERRASNLLPTFDLFADAAVRENTGTAGVVQSGVGIGAQYTLLTGMGDFRSVEAAEYSALAERWLILDLREALLLQTVRAYYEGVRAERLVQVLVSSVEAQMERLRDARARNEVGFARPLDVAQIEAQVSRTRALLISAQGQAREARATLALLTGADVTGSALVDGYTPPPDLPELHTLDALAQQYRQDVVAARDDATAARLLVDAAISQFAPAVGVNLDYFLARGPDDSASSIASLISVRVPIFSAGRIEAEVRSSWSVFRERVLDYRLRVREVRRDVEAARSQVVSSRARVEELRTQIGAARQALALAEASYEAGLGTNLERVTAQDDLLNAELQAVSEEFIAKGAYLALKRACGLLSADMIATALPQPDEREAAAPDSPLLDRAAPPPVREPVPAGQQPESAAGGAA
jgi:outer membrane protein TolC